MKKAIAFVRVSDLKNASEGDSLEFQKEQLRHMEERLGAETVKTFPVVESVGKGHQALDEALNYCKTHKGINYIFFRSIDRITRTGSSGYLYLMDEFSKLGVIPVDYYGVINHQKINTMEEFGLSYEWSEYRPSRQTEILMAEAAKEERTRILTRMISAEARFSRHGYTMGIPKFGYLHTVEQTQHGKRKIPHKNPEEKVFVEKMFELALKGIAHKDIVEELNNMGYRSRKRYRRSKGSDRKIIGEGGRKKLTIKALTRLLENPYYAGILVHKFNKHKPIRGVQEIYISIDEFNQINDGRKYILIEGEDIQILKSRPKKIRGYKRVNPDFPYKSCFRCHVCGHILKGSSPRNKRGNHIPRYHCSHNHRWWSINAKKMHDEIEEFVDEVEFTDEFKEKVHETLLDEMESLRRTKATGSSSVDKQISTLKGEKESLMQTLSQVTMPEVIKDLESKIKGKMVDIADLKQKRAKAEKQEVDYDTAVLYLRHYMENFKDLVLDTEDIEDRSVLFDLIFDEIPTWPELKNRTPKLSRIFQLKTTAEAVVLPMCDPKYNKSKQNIPRLY